MEKIFAVSSPGLEPFTEQELQYHNLLSYSSTDRIPRTIGGIEFTGDVKAIYLANLHLRTASRVLLRLGEFHAEAFSELTKHTRRLPWESFLIPGQRIAVRVTCHKSRLYHSGAVGREIISAINARLGKPVHQCLLGEDPSGDVPQLVVVRLENDECILSIDTSGALLHRRGYRLASAKAPLRETLAAGLLFASGWDFQSPLLDPFCGSGTIAIEAALMARRIAPGISRKFAFMDWPSYQPELWNAIQEAHRDAFGSKQDDLGCVAPIVASDRDAGAIHLAKENAERAGVAECIEFSQRSVSAIEPGDIGWFVTNPPYGIRINTHKDIRNLYAQMGNVIRRKCPGWQIAILCNELSLLHQMKIPLDTSITLVNGGISVYVGRSKIPLPGD
jgi:putative N6-adenine-specific DNA methylase